MIIEHLKDWLNGPRPEPEADVREILRQLANDPGIKSRMMTEVQPGTVLYDTVVEAAGREGRVFYYPATGDIELHSDEGLHWRGYLMSAEVKVYQHKPANDVPAQACSVNPDDLATRSYRVGRAVDGKGN